MLDQTPSLASMGHQQSGAFFAQENFIGYADFMSFVTRHIRTIAGPPFIALVAALVYVFTTEPTFTARSQILIDPKMPQLLREQSGEVNFSLDNAQVE